MTNPGCLHNDSIKIINGLSSIQFKNFSATFLKALGLSNIELVQEASDETVLGKGSIELGIVMSYHFVFLLKQHIGVVRDTVIEDIRNLAENNTNKGLILTTGSFSREAKKQAKAKGKIPIDLIDGKGLTQRLKDRHLRISVETGAIVEVDKELNNSCVLKPKP